MTTRGTDRSHLSTRPLAARHAAARASAACAGPLALALVAGSAWAWQPPAEPAPAQPAAQPAPQPADAAAPVDDATITETPIFIVGFKGNVGHRAEGETKWTPAKVGAMLRIGYELATGPNSMVQVQIGAGQRFTIDRASKIIITEAIARPGVEETVIDLPYGRVQFDVTSARLANDVKITAPDATLAIRGTTGGMEVNAGRPTRAYGGPLNRGRIDVRHRRGVSASITGSQATDSENPQPSINTFRDGFIEINDGRARTGDEFRFVYNFQQVFQIIFGGLNDPGGGIPPPVSGNFTVNLQAMFGPTDPIPLGTIVSLSNSIAFPRLIATPGPTNADLNSVVIGEAITANPTNNRPEFLRLERNGPTSTLRALTLDGQQTNFQNIGTFNTGTAILRGLGQVDRALYSLRNTDTSEVVRLNPLAGTINPIADFAGSRFESIDGITERGTLIMGGRLPGSLAGFDPFMTRATGFAGPDALLIEFDPRTNLIVNAKSDLRGDFVSANASNGLFSGLEEFDPTLVHFEPFPGFGFANVITNANFVGIGFTRAGLANGVGVFVPEDTLFIHMNATIDSNNNPITSNPGINQSRYVVEFRPNATSGFGAVFVSPDAILRDLTSERGPLSPSGPGLIASTNPIDFTLNPLFAQVGFTMSAISSGVPEALLRSAIIQAAMTGTVNDTSFGTLFGFVNQFAGHQSGFGKASYAFRTSLSPMDPLFLTPVVSTTLMGPTFHYIDAHTGRLIERDLFGNETNPLGLVYSAPNGLPIFGTAVWNGGGAGTGKFLLSTELFDGAMTMAPHSRISKFDLNQVPGGTIQPPQQFAFLQPAFDVDSQIADSYLFFGLGTLGNDVFASGIRAGTQVPEGGFVQGIFGVPLGATTTGPTTPDMRFFFPAEDVESGLAGAPTRGSLFVGVGLLDTATGSPAPQATGFSSLIGQAALLELDPRNQFIRNAFQSSNGDFAPLTGSGVTNGTMFVGGTATTLNSVENVLGMAYVGNKLILSAVTTSGQSVLITYNPDANNTTNARLERVEFITPGAASPIFTELGSEPVGITPLAPVSLGAASFTTTLDPDINPVFREMSYSNQAAQSGVVRNLIAEHIVDRAGDGPGCRNSAAIQMNATINNGLHLTGIIASHANQVRGVGQSITEFRSNLPPGHPCLPGMPAVP